MNKAKEQTLFENMYGAITDSSRQPFMGWLLEHAAREYPDRIALIYHDEKTTYKKLYSDACRISNYLKSNGVAEGDRVLLYIENSPFFFAAYYGVWQLGAVVAPLNFFLHPKELEHICQDAEPHSIITMEEKIAAFEEIKLHCTPRIYTEKTVFGDAQQPIADITIPRRDHTALAVLLYTSGTTGMPKGVMLSSKNIATNMAQSIIRLKLTQEERAFCVLPLFHAFSQITCVWISIFLGATIILVPKIERHFIAQNLVHEPTVFLGVPPLYGLLCLIRGIAFPRVKYFISGADALSDKVRAAFGLIYRRKLCNGYGLTECGPVVSVDLEDELEPAGNAGAFLYGMTYSLRDHEGKEVPQGHVGQLFVKGDNVMMGYYHAEEQTRAVLKDGFLDTGDLAYIDVQGKLVIAGREKDVIKHKGINIYPQEIENIISLHPDVIRVGIIGKDDELSGQIPIAFVQLRTELASAENVLKKLCQQHLAAYKIPKTFICSTKELPTTVTGKVDKKKLRAI
jgi:long-chain acyl-CoA synthetase